MHTFFHSWRRKAGLFALVVACTVMANLFMERVQREREAVRRIQCKNNLRWPPLPPRPYEVVLREYRQAMFADFSYLPHLAIASPLTLLSAILLFWPQRKHSPKTANSRITST